MIEAAHLTKRYGAVTAVDDLCFRVGRGEVFGLLGPNGAGKSTTIKIFTALCRPDYGECFVDGLNVAGSPLEVKRRIGVVPQENNLDRELTAYENLFVYALLHRVDDRRRKVQEALALVGLEERRDHLTHGFSGGMQRRLLIARALLGEPAVLFLDEPTTGLDPQIRHQVWDIIRKARLDGRTVVLTTHYIEEAEALCDRVGILARGALIALETPDNLKATVGQYVVQHVDPSGRLIQQIVKSREEGHRLAGERNGSVTVRKTNLEDVFIKLTGERIE